MAKPKIILADTDEMYLSALEIEFLEESNDNIDLEVITDTDYFNEHFSVPQSADILVVSENLYFNGLQKQNISKIYVLVENDEDNSLDSLGITKIFKYTTTTKIYNEIIATSGIGTRDVKKVKETLVVLFFSAAGGVGKTTLSMSMANCLVKNFKKVLYINAHRLNSFQFYLKNSSTMPSSVYAELATLDTNIFNRIEYVIRNEGFDYLPPFAVALSSINIDFSIYENIIKSAKATKKYDVIIVDTDSTFDYDKASLITMADKVVIVTTQSKASVNATNMLIKNINLSEKEKYMFVCNKFDTNAFNALTEKTSIKPNFMVGEYIKKISDIDSMELSDIANDQDMQKLLFLII